MEKKQLHVISLRAENIMRLSAVEIHWDPKKAVLTIGGKNGAGKSSTVNIVAMALGGANLCPEEPLKLGEMNGFAEVNLGDLVARREFFREHLPCDCIVSGNKDKPKEKESDAHAQNCATLLVGETKSRLILRNAEGITLGTPQSILDKLVSKHSFDPTAFVHEDAKRQDEILRRIVNLDVSEFESKRLQAFERRKQFNKQHEEGLIRLKAMPQHKDVPAEEVSMEEVTTELKRAEELRTISDAADKHVNAISTLLTTGDESRVRQLAAVDALRQQLDAATEALANIEKARTELANKLTGAQAVAKTAREAIPEVTVISEKLKEIEATNAKVRANKAYTIEANAVEKIGLLAKDEDARVTAMVEAKRKALEAATFPVPGLSLEDTGVTFGGIPFKQASTAEQIRVSVAIGFALNPGLKLLVIRNGNALDEDSMKLVAEEAEKAGGQILMEYVTKDASQVSVMIEDGRVKP